MKATPVQIATMARYRARRREKCVRDGICYYCRKNPITLPDKTCEGCRLGAKMRRLGLEEGTP